MHISDEGILTQLGYPTDEANLRQLSSVKENTPGFENIKKHIIALSDHLKPYGGYVTFSNSKPCFKIKIDRNAPSVDKALEEIFKWADKYNVKLLEVKEKETYYILGIEK
jgi:hypothetical protein